MNIKDLKEKIKDLPDDMEIVCLGEYSLGTEVKSANVEKLIFAEEGILVEEQEYLAINIDSYIAENIDIGSSEMYLPKKSWDELFLHQQSE